MSNPKKVCIVSHSAGVDGAERVLMEAVEVLQEAGIECLVVFPYRGPLLQAMENRGGVCKVLRYPRWVGDRKPVWKCLLSAAFSLWSAVRLSAYLARNPCDLIITNTIVIPVGALAATFARIPHVWWIHEFGKEDHGLKFDLGERFSTWVMDRTSILVLANSVAVASKFQVFIRKDKIRLLYYSVHLNSSDAGECAAREPNTRRPRVCVPGRLSVSKGQQDAMRALKKLKDDGVDAEMVFVGSTQGDYSKQLAVLSKQLGVEDQVEFTGYVENPLPVMSSCDVAVVCSRCEAFGRVTIEAMKLGKPVVGTRSGGTAELIQDGFNGFLYAVGNFEDLASKLRIPAY